MNNDVRKTDPILSDPVAVSDHALEVTRQAYMDRDFTLFRMRFILPQVLGTFNGDQVLETEADLRVLFDKVCALLDNNGVIDLQRRTLSARFLAPDRVQATFVTQYLLPSLAFSDETFGHGTLRLVDGLWRIEESRYAAPNNAITQALSIKGQD